VKAYEVRKLFSIWNEETTPFLNTDGVRKTFLLNRKWQDPITGLSGFASMAQLPARPGQYWKVKWNYRYRIVAVGGESNQVVTLGFEINKPTGGTEEFSQSFDQDFGDYHSGTLEMIVSPLTSPTRPLNLHGGWTKIKCFGVANASGPLSQVFLLPYNEIVLELWNGPLPNTNRLKNTGPNDPRYEVAPENF
jgi:hypothetical protein